jgi:hypothetical protein
MWTRGHLSAVCMTYAQHLRFSLGLSARLLGAALAALVHALVPGLCAASTSRLAAELPARLAAAGCR